MSRDFEGINGSALEDASATAFLPERQQVAKSVIPASNLESTEHELRRVLRQCKDLPEEVRVAKFTRVEQRRLDEALLTTLLSQCPPAICHEDWDLRLLKRKQSLRKHLDKVLHCIFIQLPGVHYTIEVDLEARAVAYWEWQRL